MVFGGPRLQPWVRQFIHELDDRGRLLDQSCAGQLPTAILPRPGSQAPSLISRHSVEPALATLAAREDPACMQLTADAPAVGLATFAAQQIERTLGHGGIGLEHTQSSAERSIGPPKLLA